VEVATVDRAETQLITSWAPQPVERVAMLQTWRRLTFLHWSYEPSEVRRLLPPGLELDTLDGAAWVGLVPFEIYDLRGIPHFPETNVRTYVIGPDGGRGVWFFSLDAARLAAVVGARVGYRLPYYWATMQVIPQDGAIRYCSRRKGPHDSNAITDLVVQPGKIYEVKELTARDSFLTARFRLYTMLRKGLGYAQIEHEPWPLTRATVLELNQTLIEASGLAPPKAPPLVHYSAELKVKIGYPQLCV
jgi:uncharacterized protein YqjF (DUF2071 family)